MLVFLPTSEMIRISNTQYVHFLQQADDLRRSGLFCDATISVESQTFRAHRLVLACASRTLAQLLAQGDVDSPGHCTLEYFLPRTFQQVLDFTYTEALEVSVADLHLLLRAAQLLEMQPLEEQCRKQLDTLSKREVGKKREITDVKEENESAEETDEKEKGNLVSGEANPPEEEASDDVPPPEPAQSHDSPQSLIKKARLSPISAMADNRDSVITRPVTSMSSFPSPWTFPMWNLKQIADYSNLIAAQPLQSANQPSVAYPISLSTGHIPLMHAPFRSPSSLMGYPSIHPCYKQNLYPGPTGRGSIIKQGLFKRRRNNPTAFTRTGQTAELSYPQVPNTSEKEVKDCQHCRLGVPVLQESASTPSAVVCAGCRFCGRGDVVQHESQSQRQDHRGEKPYQCQRCPKKFSLKHQLDTHHRVHTGEKPFECRLCGQRSRDYSAMIKHLRTHGGAAPYRCTVCLEFCSSLVAMQRHIKNHAVQEFPPDWSINSTYLYISHTSAL